MAFGVFITLTLVTREDKNSLIIWKRSSDLCRWWYPTMDLLQKLLCILKDSLMPSHSQRRWLVFTVWRPNNYLSKSITILEWELWKLYFWWLVRLNVKTETLLKK
jgi:hypothetical protein